MNRDMNMCIYIYTYVYIHNIYTKIYTHIDIYTHTCIYIYINIYLYISIYMHIYIYVYIYTDIYMKFCTHTGNSCAAWPTLAKRCNLEDSAASLMYYIHMYRYHIYTHVLVL